MTQPPVTPTLLAYAFRPFFLLTAAYAVLIVLAWVAFVFGGLALPLGWSPLQWHSHEMLYGVVPAAIAGFVLTAMTNWTGAQPVRGKALLGLILLWLAGRVGMWLVGSLPATPVALLEFAFLPVLAIVVTITLLRHNNRRNLILVGVLLLLTLGNGLMHAGFVFNNTHLLRLGQQMGFDVTALMIVIIAGRIIPAFTGNWLRNRGGNPDWVVRSPWVERLALGSAVALVLLNLISAPSWLVGATAVVAGAANGVRLWLWAGWRTLHEPLLWILHLSYLWLVAALLLRGLSSSSAAVPASLWQHAMGLGAIMTLILAVMTRVSLGHTGRPMVLPPFALWIYVSIIAATVFRLLAAVQWMDYRLGVTLAAIAWVQGFTLFIVFYWRILSGPRADGRPG